MVNGVETDHSTIFRLYNGEEASTVTDVTVEIISGPWPTYPQPRWCDTCLFTRVSKCTEDTTRGGVLRFYCDYIGAGAVIGFAVEVDADKGFAGGTVVVSNAEGTLRYEFD